MKILKPVLLFIAIVLIGVGIGWLASRQPSKLPAASTGNTGQKTADAGPAATPAPLRLGVQSQNTNEVPNPEMVAETSEVSTNPDDMISDIIGGEAEVTNIVTKLAELYPKLSEAGKLEAVEHLTNLVPDEDYRPLAKILTNGTVSEAVASHILSDLIARPNNVKMPLMMAVARDPNNPGAKEAKENLELIISPEEDPGTDWNKWQKAVDDWMKENPD